MVHATTTLAQGFNPYILTPSNHREKVSTLHKSLETDSFFDIASLINTREHALLTLTAFFEESKILKRLAYTLIPAGNLYVEDRVMLKFSLADRYASYFSLLRGLFGFGKAAHVRVNTDSSDKTFVIEVSADHAESIIPYFEKIFSWLAKEIRFKTALKQVIKLQEEAKKSQQEAFNALYDSLD